MSIAYRYNPWSFEEFAAEAICVVAPHTSRSSYEATVYDQLRFLYLFHRVICKSVNHVDSILSFRSALFNACFDFCDLADMILD